MNHQIPCLKFFVAHSWKKFIKVIETTIIDWQCLQNLILEVCGQENWDQVHKFPHMGKFMHLIHFKYQLKKFCTPRSLSPTLYTPFQCTLPRTFTYQACPFSVHCLSFNALPAEILMFLRINLITNWGKFCTCCCLGENFALVPRIVDDIDFTNNQINSCRPLLWHPSGHLKHSYPTYTKNKDIW